MILRPLFNIITKKDSFCKLQRLLISTKTFYKYFVYYANATSVTVSIQAVARLSYLKFSLPYAPKTPPKRLIAVIAVESYDRMLLPYKKAAIMRLFMLYSISKSSDINIGSSKNSITVILNPRAIILTVFITLCPYFLRA